jgi:hypothetical protein
MYPPHEVMRENFLAQIVNIRLLLFLWKLALRLMIQLHRHLLSLMRISKKRSPWLPNMV